MHENNHGRIRPKKSLGQHFLRDQNIARKIVDALQRTENEVVLEVGPGMGVLTQYLLEREGIRLKLSEIDRDAVAYLKDHYPMLKDSILEGDFLELDLAARFPGEKISVIGNFPYNISSQIFFRVLDHRDQVVQVVGMLQKEVADRIAAPHGSKVYGILSVLLQAFYKVEYLFRVAPGVFHPPPKVVSAVVRLTRNDREHLGCSEPFFFQVVKQGFNNRRKTLRNALKNLNLAIEVSALPMMDKRAEQLSVDDFIKLTRIIEDSRAGTIA